MKKLAKDTKIEAAENLTNSDEDIIEDIIEDVSNILQKSGLLKVCIWAETCFVCRPRN